MATIDLFKITVEKRQNFCKIAEKALHNSIYMNIIKMTD